MSQPVYKLEATLRSDTGRSASRRARRDQGEVPAIIYGGKSTPTPVSFAHNKVWQALEHESFYSQILTLKVDGKEQKAVLKEVQRHPFKRLIQHLDFMRVSDTDVITMKVPLHFINEDSCPGVKAGGIINHLAIDLEIRCQAKNLPEFIEVDLGNLQLDQSIHLSELQLPKEVEIAAFIGQQEIHDTAVVNVHLPRQMKEETEEELAASAPASSAPASGAPASAATDSKKDAK